MTTEELKELAIKNILSTQVDWSFGVYAKSVTGGDHPYEKRSEWQEGWNAAVFSRSKRQGIVTDWFENLSEECRSLVEELLFNESLSLRIHEDSLTMNVNCNDLFYWACADFEDITLEELPELLAAMKESKFGDSLWICRKRNMRPQTPYYKFIPKEEWSLFNAVGPERND